MRGAASLLPPALIVLALAATQARAREPGLPRIVLVVDAEGDALALELAADSRLAGFAIESVRATSDSLEGLMDTARSHDAVAAVRIVRDASRVEIRIADRLTDKLVVRTISRASLASAGGEPLLALRVVELLRGSLVELTLPEAPAALRTSEPLPAAIVEQVLPVTPAHPRFRLHAGLGAGLAPGGLSPTYIASVGAGVRLARRISAVFGFVAPVEPARLSAAAAEAELSPLIGSIGLRRDFMPSTGRIHAALGAGVAGLWMRATGAPPPGGTGQASSANKTAGAPYLSLHAAYALRTFLHVGLDALAAYALPSPVLRANDEAIARWGRPFILLTCNVSLLAP